MTWLMPSLTAEGIILGRRNFGEADRIITVLTKRFGKISVMARGVRKITSRRAGNVEILNRVKLHLFKGKGYTLTEAESIETFSLIKSNLTLASYAFYLLELTNRLLLEEQPNLPIYNLLLETLDQLRRSPRQILIRGFEVKLLSQLGFWSVNALSDLKPEIKELLFRLESENSKQINRIKLERKDALELELVLRYYIERTLEGELRSLKMIKQLGE